MEHGEEEERLILAFLGALATPALPPSRLGAQLSRGLRRGRAKYPAVQLSDECFARYVAQHCPGAALPEDALDAMYLEELYLAAGVVNLDPAARAVFDRCFLSDVGNLISSFGRDAGFIEEVTQRMRLKVYGDGNAEPKIRQYAGLRPLNGWLGVMAKRVAIDVQRASPALASAEDAEEAGHLLPTAADQELELLRRRHASDYSAALRECVAALVPEQRNMLRLYYVQRLTMDKIGVLKGVTASTVLRRLKAICERVLACVRDKLISKGDVSPSNFDSISRLVRSQLDLSIGTILELPSS